MHAQFAARGKQYFKIGDQRWASTESEDPPASGECILLLRVRAGVSLLIGDNLCNDVSFVGNYL